MLPYNRRLKSKARSLRRNQLTPSYTYGSACGESKSWGAIL